MSHQRNFTSIPVFDWPPVRFGLYGIVPGLELLFAFQFWKSWDRMDNDLPHLFFSVVMVPVTMSSIIRAAFHFSMVFSRLYELDGLLRLSASIYEMITVYFLVSAILIGYIGRPLKRKYKQTTMKFLLIANLFICISCYLLRERFITFNLSLLQIELYVNSALTAVLLFRFLVLPICPFKCDNNLLGTIAVMGITFTPIFAIYPEWIYPIEYFVYDGGFRYENKVYVQRASQLSLSYVLLTDYRGFIFLCCLHGFFPGYRNLWRYAIGMGRSNNMIMDVVHRRQSSEVRRGEERLESVVEETPRKTQTSREFP